MSSKSFKKILNINGKNVEIDFKYDFDRYQKNKEYLLNGYSVDGDFDMFSFAVSVDNKNILRLSNSNESYLYKITDGNELLSTNGKFNVDVNTKSNAKDETLRSFILSRIAYRFCSMIGNENRFDFFGHVMYNLYNFLSNNKHNREAECLLSFVTRNPMHGAALFFQFSTPLNKSLASHYIPTHLLSKWFFSSSGDEALGYSVSESNYKKESMELFNKATNYFRNLKISNKSLSSIASKIHSNAKALPKNENTTNIYENLVLGAYKKFLGQFLGNRIDVLNENPNLALHDSLSLYSLTRISENDSPEVIMNMIFRSGMKNVMDAQIFELKNVDDETFQLDFISNVIDTNLVMPIQAVVYKTDVDYMK